MKSSLNVDASQDAYQSQDPLIRSGGTGSAVPQVSAAGGKHQIPTLSKNSINVRKSAQKEQIKGGAPAASKTNQAPNTTTTAGSTEAILTQENYLDSATHPQ